MTWQGWAEIALTIGLSAALAWPLGLYLARVFQGGRTWLDPVMKPAEALIYRACGVDPQKGQGWTGYTASLLAFNGLGFILLYAILRLQGLLALNPLHFAGMSPHLAFNTAISFVTNTNWQSYARRNAPSPTSAKMAGLTVQNFASAAAGASRWRAALARAFAAQSGPETLGNFWRRPRPGSCSTSCCRCLRSCAVALVLVAQGIPQTLAQLRWTPSHPGRRQADAFPWARSPARRSIKQLGTNGGGFFNANSAHPFENPNAPGRT